MPLIYSKQQKKQKYLLLAFAAIILINVVVVWFAFFREESPKQIPVSSFFPQEPNIDIDFLKNNALLKELIQFEEIPIFEGQSGRTTPFLPY